MVFKNNDKLCIYTYYHRHILFNYGTTMQIINIIKQHYCTYLFEQQTNEDNTIDGLPFAYKMTGTVSVTKIYTHPTDPWASMLKTCMHFGLCIASQSLIT